MTITTAQRTKALPSLLSRLWEIIKRGRHNRTDQNSSDRKPKPLHSPPVEGGVGGYDETDQSFHARVFMLPDTEYVVLTERHRGSILQLRSILAPLHLKGSWVQNKKFWILVVEDGASITWDPRHGTIWITGPAAIQNILKGQIEALLRDDIPRYEVEGISIFRRVKTPLH